MLKIRFSKTAIIVISVILFILVTLHNCSNSNYQVECDSGFKTPVSDHAGIDNGIIYWGNGPIIETRRSVINSRIYRVMLKGETCWKNRIKNK